MLNRGGAHVVTLYAATDKLLAALPHLWTELGSQDTEDISNGVTYANLYVRELRKRKRLDALVVFCVLYCW